ncbi:hypothetical protein HPP92_002069 [Vanilla planifolia]|uniref:Uncharacterized protein n=1 Tax=Vanilla planifolia TaxID=51239 RepID=A0A835VHJ3_VANPL|nr:hypothetical protein HPP92_002069 [Vanilla planifolia]
MAEFADFNGKLSKRASKKVLPQSVGSTTTSNDCASTSGVASQTASGVLSGSGVLNARPGSTTSSGLLSQMVSSLNADVAREYLEKVADLLLEFAQADSTILKCINHLSGDPHCLEYLQRADAIKHLIPNLELHEGPFVSQIHNEGISTS